MSQPTVVSAYYPIPSKTTVHKYVEWMFSFWPKTKCPLVFFTDPLIVPQIEAMFKERQGPTKVIGIPFQNLVAFTKLSPRAWIFTHQFDPEKIHSPELYAIWYEKKEFVLRAIQDNPFGSDHFVWCDAGIGRYPDWLPHLERFPMREAMPPANKMLVLRMKAFTDVNIKENTVGGGILASDIGGWVSWSKAYDAMLMKYYLNDAFIGKDQNIMASVILENPDSVVMIDPPPINAIQQWFYLLFYLGGVRVSP